jgi:hypothetical protein
MLLLLRENAADSRIYFDSGRLLFLCSNMSYRVR